MFPTSLAGEPLEPRLPTTAALSGYQIDTAHADVIERALSSDAARRIGPDYWGGAEAQLADWAHLYRPDDEPQINELHMRSDPNGGGRIKGQLDAPTFEVLTRAIRASLTPETDEHKTLGERQADALAAICEHALNDGHLPCEGGQRPHITAVLDYDQLAQHARGAALELGGYTPPAQLRRILCDSCVTPVVLGGTQSCSTSAAPTAPPPRPNAPRSPRETAGGAHPGYDKTPAWCSVHHIVGRWWPHRPRQPRLPMFAGPTMVHQPGWAIRMRNGLPEFIPPKWLDVDQVPRTNRHRILV
ncbi:MAG: 13E12 repeat family protein [Actinomycetota bacterium]|nr:13E12 repeat family protein [Actinomycetota bacterium]